MRLPKLILLALALFCCAHFENLSQAQSKGAKQGTSTVSGKVTLKGEPLRGVTVTLRIYRNTPVFDPSSIYRGKTDESGRFLITGLAAGRYSVDAVAPGYISSESASFGPQGRVLNISDGESIENVNIDLSRGGVITGRVIDSNYRPLVEEYVQLMRVDQNGKPQQPFNLRYGDAQFTDDRGVYRIYGIPVGRYLVSVGSSQNDGMSGGPFGRSFYSKTYHPDVNEEARAKIIEVTEGSETTEVDITVAEARKTYSIHGRVVNADTGQPMMGVEVSCGMLAPGGRGVSSWGEAGEVSNARGEFRLQNIMPGKHLVFGSNRQESDFYSEPTVCEIIDSDIHGIEVNVRQGSTISGVVVIEGTNDPAILTKLLQMRITTYSRSEQLSAPSRSSAQINPNGSFRLKGVPPGKVYVAPSYYTPSFMSQQGALLRVERDGVIQSEGIEIGPGENVSNVRVVIGYGALSLRGEVRIIGGALPPNYRLYIHARRVDQELQNNRGAELDIRGQFVLENMMPGQYELHLSPIRYSAEAPEDRNFANAVAQVKQRVTVSSGNQPVVTLVLDLSKQGGNQ
jgi:hypothetical protein